MLLRKTQYYLQEHGRDRDGSEQHALDYTVLAGILVVAKTIAARMSTLDS